ncbi:MAG: exodeoxyribonuclease V subunit gamma [Myxococcota bacterium]|nr:exodeoxyribonuclease V subunit gamma [Myxococcota bacterium]
MLNVYRSNRMERLVDAFVRVLHPPPGDPFLLEWVAVHSRAMETWLRMALASRLGIWAGAYFPFPRALIEHLLGTAYGSSTTDWSAYTRENLAWRVSKYLPLLRKHPEFRPLDAYLNDDKTGVICYQLSHQIARVFDEYAVYRPEMVLEWEHQRPNHWQAILWNAIAATIPHDHIATGARRFLRAVETGSIDPKALPARIFLFGIYHLPPLFVHLLAAASTLTEVHLFLSSPSREYWGYISKWGGQSGGVQANGTTAGTALFEDAGHPLLASLGQLGRDFQSIFEAAATYAEPLGNLYEDPVTPMGHHLLQSVQSDLLHLRDRREGDTGSAPAAPIPTEDRSIQIHSCHSPMREVEVLFDQLLDLFDDPDLCLRPEDVLVAAPDISVYAPFIHAVFHSDDTDIPTFPYRIIGRVNAPKPQVSRAFLSILELAASRLTAQEVFELLRIAPVRQRFGLNESEVETACDWMVDIGVRWGIDKHHRTHFGQPAYEENTWRFGLQRLFLGYAMPGRGETLFQGVLPYDEIEGTEAAIAGHLAAFLDALFRWVRYLRKPRPAAEWRTGLCDLLAEMLLEDRQTTSDHQRIREVLATLEHLTAAAGYDGALDLEVVRSFARDRLSDTEAISLARHIGVTCCSLLPMGDTPHKVVCLMGMNEGDFPRIASVPSFDLIAEAPRLGDRRFRTDDQYLFLLALLSARERFIITYVGQDPQDNSRRPPAVVVEELIEAIEIGYYLKDLGESCPGAADRGSLRQHLVVYHPLQPFSPRYFDGGDDPRLFSYRNAYCDGALAHMERERRDRPFVQGPLPLEVPPRETIALTDLSRFLLLPARYFLRERLGLAAGSDLPLVDTREPIEPDPLDTHALGTALLEMGRSERDLERLWDLFRAKGVLPLGAVGRVRFQAVAQHIASILDAWKSASRSDPLAPLDVTLSLHVGQAPVVLTGHLDNLWPSVRLGVRYGGVTPNALIDMWIHHLALCSMAPEAYPRRSMLIGFTARTGLETAVLSPVSTESKAILTDLVAIFLSGQQEPIRFFPAASMAYALAMDDASDAAIDPKAMAKARAAWVGSYEYERADNAIQRLYTTWDMLEENSIAPDFGFCQLASRLFTPLLRHLERR